MTYRRLLSLALISFSSVSTSEAKSVETPSYSLERVSDPAPSASHGEIVFTPEERKILCGLIARKEWLNKQTGDNSKQRNTLAACLQGGSLTSRGVSTEIIGIGDVPVNSKGIQLEHYNIWFYKPAPDGKQQASINIYHPTIAPISWVVVGFHPVCGSEEGYKWALRLKLPAPASPQENAAWVWEVPKGLALSDKSCLDILSAG